MKRILMLVLLAVALASPASASTVSLYGTNWDTNDLDDTFGGGLAFGLTVAESMVDIDLRAAYQEETTDEPVEALFEDENTVFEPDALRIVPVEAGLRVNFNREGAFNPYVGGGASYFFIDEQRPNVEIDDEVGWYGLVGSRFGDSDGASLFLEATYRNAEATAERGDIGDIVDRVELDLGGFGGNIGVIWRW